MVWPWDIFEYFTFDCYTRIIIIIIIVFIYIAPYIRNYKILFRGAYYNIGMSIDYNTKVQC